MRSGYYDSYQSIHNSGITRKTGAHNTVTVATNRGQSDDDATADGQLEAFLTQVDFDLVKGDATESYKGAIGEFERSIVYIRPDIFVVVDDLKAKNKKGSNFEWWLHSLSDIKTYKEGNGARLQQGKAVLDAIVQYPQKVTTYYNDNFALSDMKEYLPEGSYLGAEAQKRVWFETDKVESTKMIVTLDVHKDNKEARNVNTKYFDKYVEMTFEDGTTMYVNLGDESEEVVTAEGLSFGCI